jgi:hypothetical protein
MRFDKYLTTCAQCGGKTNKSYARKHEGKCKTCVTGVAPAPRRRSYDDIAREGGYEDTMGVSPEALESWRNGGYYGDY